MENQFIEVHGHLINRAEIEFASFIRDREILVRFSSGYVLKFEPDTSVEGDKVMRALKAGEEVE